MPNQAKILLIEDHYMTQDLIRLFLERHQLQADTIDTGEGAMALVAQKHYKLVICDLGLPDYEGFDLIKTVKGRNLLNHAIWLGITAQIYADLNQQAKEAGYTALLEKPLTELTEVNGVPIVEFINKLILAN